MDLRPGRGALIHVGKFVLSLGWTYTQRGALIYGGKFVLGLRWTYTQRGAHIHGGKFVLGLGWTYTRRGGTYSWREVCVWFRMGLHTEGGHLFMEGSLC